MDGSVVRYNQLAHRLKLVPASAKRADGVTYEMRINRDAAVPAELSNLDLKVPPGWPPARWGHSNHRSLT